MHLILTGATGLVGSAVLDAMIKTKDITKISIISRRPVKMAEDAKDPRINVILHKDFETYDRELLEKLKGAQGCVWALGVSQNAVGREYVFSFVFLYFSTDLALSLRIPFRCSLSFPFLLLLFLPSHFLPYSHSHTRTIQTMTNN